jgi:hypothetical protein
LVSTYASAPSIARRTHAIGLVSVSCSMHEQFITRVRIDARAAAEISGQRLEGYRLVFQE